MRVFIALTPSAAQLRQVVEEVQQPLAGRLAAVRWVGVGAMHITLRFLGEMGGDRVPELTAALARAAAGVAPFDLALGAPGVFPAERNARVLWLALAEGGQETARLAAAVERELVASGFEPAERPCFPHLTLGRARAPIPPHTLRSALADHGHFRTPTARIGRVTLYQSHLRPEGAEHVALFAADLAAAPNLPC